MCPELQHSTTYTENFSLFIYVVILALLYQICKPPLCAVSLYGITASKYLGLQGLKKKHVLGECSLKNWYPKFIINCSYKNGNRLCQVSSLKTNFKYCCFGQIESTIIVAPFRDWQNLKSKVKKSFESFHSSQWP